MKTISHRYGQRLAAFIMMTVLLFGVQAGVVQAFATELSADSAVNSEVQSDRLTVLEGQVADLETRLKLEQKAVDETASEDVRIGSLNERLGAIEAVLGMESQPLPTDKDQQMDVLNGRILLANAKVKELAFASAESETPQVESTQESELTNRLSEMEELSKKTQKRVQELEDRVDTIQKFTAVGLLIAILALVTAIVLGVVNLMMTLRAKKSANDAGAYANQQDLKKLQENLNRELKTLQKENSRLRNELTTVQNTARSETKEENVKSYLNESPSPKTVSAEPELVSPQVPIANVPKQSSSVVGNLKAVFDMTLSDNIFMTKGSDYILYDDNTLEYSMRMPYGEISAYARNGLLRLYDIQVNDTIYTYQQYKNKKCPNAYVQVKDTLKRAEVKINAAGTYDLVEPGLLRAELLS